MANCTAWLFAGAAAIAAIPAPLLAQQTAPTDAAEASPLEDIIVTARRTRERLQDTPVSVTAFSAQTLESAGLTDISDIAQRTPGLQYGSFGDVKLSPTSLRGIVGSSGSAGADPAVGYYIDEVFVSQGVGANLDLYDIDRVEVLRGPQGVLFGRNTIGGVISITTKRPTANFEFSATGEIGNYDYRRLGASVSGPLIGDTVLAKLAVVGQERGGTDYNELLDRRVNTQGFWSARGQLLFNISDDTSLLLTGDYQRVKQQPLVFETLSYDPKSDFVALLGAYGIKPNADPFDRRVQSDIISQERSEAEGVAATFRTKIGAVNLTNILSYHHHDYFSRSDTDRSALRLIYDGDPEKVERWSEELRIDGTVGRFDWLAGVYYYSQNSSNQSYIDIGSDLADVLGAPEIAGLRTGSDGSLKTRSIAGFASVTWRATDRFDVSVGGRYTRDRKRIAYTQNDPLALLGGNADIKASDSYGQFTPSVNVRYRFSDEVLGYATASKGYKSGGFNDALGDADGIAFGPEKLWNYEVGLKTELFNRRATLNVAAFHMKWSSIQITSDNPRTPIYDPTIVNGGSAHSNGIEAELSARPVERLQIGTNFSILSAKYDGGVLADGTPLRFIAFAPAYTVAANISYDVPLGGFGDLTLLAEYNRRGTTYLGADNDPDGRVAAFGLVNARATLRPRNAAWSISAWAKNLTNETYITRLFDQTNSTLIGQKQIILGEPRTYGATVRVDFR